MFCIFAAFHQDGFFTITTLQLLNPTVPLFAILCYILFAGYKAPSSREWQTFNQHVLELLKTNQRTILPSQFLLAASLIYFHIWKKGTKEFPLETTERSMARPQNTPSPTKEEHLDYMQVLSQMFCTILFLYLQLTRNIVGEMKIFGHFYFPT